jgi:hypothetical protein
MRRKNCAEPLVGKIVKYCVPLLGAADALTRFHTAGGARLVAE